MGDEDLLSLFEEVIKGQAEIDFYSKGYKSANIK
jgi:hypothetical protein